MGRIGDKFESLRRKKEKALIVYLTAGDPSLEITKKLIFALEKAEVDILEIGVPFSDPTARLESRDHFGRRIEISHRSAQNF